MGFFKNLITKQAMKSQLKNLPADQQEKILAAMENNPEFFEKIANEIKQKQKEGKGEMQASMEVMREHQGEFQKMMM